MGSYAAAVQLAQRGFSVFPLYPDSKEPVHADWPSMATKDLYMVEKLWIDPVLRTDRGYNIGILCNDMVVVDIDVKNGKDGYNEYMQMGGNFDTLVVRTPTGGYHCYFNGPDSSNASLSASVDIRSHNGYVVAPGSTINGVPYDIINDQQLAWVPGSIQSVLKPPYTRNEAETFEHLDTPAALFAGQRFLESAPPAIEGQRGDETTFKVAARLVREMGLSVPAAFELLRDHYNPRCVPPWPLEELLTKLHNAASYGTADLGRLTPEVMYGHLPPLEPPPTVFAQMQSPWGNAIVPASLPPRPWLMDRALMLRAVTLLLATGSAGKSSISLAIAAHLALGKDFAGFKARHGCKTIVYNGEDDLEEQSRRLLAVCMGYGFDFDQVKQNIMLLSPRQLKLDLVAQDRGRPYRNDVLVDNLIREASNPDVGVLILDPLVKIHRCDESDNVQMDFVMETLTDIAYHANVAVLALHHTTKASSKQEDKVGNADIARGASAIVNASRIAFTMMNATNQDAEDYGMQIEERNMWVRLDDAKMNLSLAGDKAVWFRKEGIKLPNSDIVGILRNEQLEKSHHHIRIRLFRIIRDTLTTTGQGSLPIQQAVAVVKQNEPLWANKTDLDIRRKLEGFFSTAIEIEGGTLQLIRDMSDNSGPDKVYFKFT